MVIATAACGRGPPAPSADASAPSAEAPEPQLAGGPRPESPITTETLPPLGEAAQNDAAAPTIISPTAIMPAAVTPEGLANAPASVRGGPAGEIPDPLQRLNRRMFGVDQTMRRVVLERFSSFSSVSAPTAPAPVQQGLGQAIRNLDEPGTLANQILQRKPIKALRTAARFLINSTLGVAGLFDVARKFGLKPAHADFAQTLASYGVGPGAYLYVPIKGPTSVRDVAGGLVDAYFWPLHWVRVGWAVNQGITLARLETQPKHDDPGFRYARRSPAGPGADPYVLARRDYARKREDEIRDRTPQQEPVLAGGPAMAGGSQVSLRPHRRITVASAS
jgi:phospholipid-binding lipoprotein MlaA